MRGIVDTMAAKNCRLAVRVGLLRDSVRQIVFPRYTPLRDKGDDTEDTIVKGATAAGHNPRATAILSSDTGSDQQREHRSTHHSAQRCHPFRYVFRSVHFFFFFFYYNFFWNLLLFPPVRNGDKRKRDVVARRERVLFLLLPVNFCKKTLEYYSSLEKDF